MQAGLAFIISGRGSRRGDRGLDQDPGRKYSTSAPLMYIVRHDKKKAVHGASNPATCKKCSNRNADI